MAMRLGRCMGFSLPIAVRHALDGIGPSPKPQHPVPAPAVQSVTEALKDLLKRQRQIDSGRGFLGAAGGPTPADYPAQPVPEDRGPCLCGLRTDPHRVADCGSVRPGFCAVGSPTETRGASTEPATTDRPSAG